MTCLRLALVADTSLTVHLPLSLAYRSAELYRYMSEVGAFSSLARTRPFVVEPPAVLLGFDVHEEGSDITGDHDGLKQELGWGVKAAGWGVGGVLFARDVFGVKRSIAIFCKLKDASEYTVGGPDCTAPFPLSLDDASVVSMECDVLTRSRQRA